MSPFDLWRKHEETGGFLMFSGGSTENNGQKWVKLRFYLNIPETIKLEHEF